MNVAVGFNPRREFLPDTLVAERRLNRRASKRNFNRRYATC
jgi:hypothetical protein